MQIIINIVLTFMLMFWPILLMMSPMMFDAPGSENDKSHATSMMLVLCYPIGIFILLWMFGGSYFGYGGFKLVVISSVIVVSALSVFGYFGMLLNLHKGIANSGYSVVDQNVYYDGKLLEGADGETFNTLASERRRDAPEYATDKNFLYYSGKVVEGASIKQLKNKVINMDEYWLNNEQVIYDGKILPDANPAEFSGFEGFTGWVYSISDGRYIVYSYGVPLPGVDKLTFSPLNDFIAKDKHHVFEKHNLILNNVDAVTFELLEDHDFARDKNYIYYISTKQPFAVEGIDPDSFEILDRGYLKDKNNVYHVVQYERIEKMEQADVETFEATQYDDVNKSEATDAKHYYYDGLVVGDR